MSGERATDPAGLDVRKTASELGIHNAALFGVYSSSAIGSLGRMVITLRSPEIRLPVPLLNPALRRTAGGTTSGDLLLFLTATVICAHCNQNRSGLAGASCHPQVARISGRVKPRPALAGFLLRRVFDRSFLYFGVRAGEHDLIAVTYVKYPLTSFGPESRCNGSSLKGLSVVVSVLRPCALNILAGLLNQALRSVKRDFFPAVLRTCVQL